ncbi:hypothetical protein ACJJTC_004109 [Scirpophaga incertulas]
MDFECVEPDSTCKQTITTSLNIPNSVKKFTAKKGSLSDTDLLTIDLESKKKDKRKGKKLVVNVKPVSPTQLADDNCSSDQSSSHEGNTPKHVLLDSKCADLFSQHFKDVDLNHSFDLYDVMSEHLSVCEQDNISIQSLPESDTDFSLGSDSDEKEIKMCRKVEPESDDNELERSISAESFGDVEVDKNEAERQSVLANYQTEFAKIEGNMKKLLSELKFHIEVSQIFKCRSAIASLPNNSRSSSRNKLDMDNQGRASSASSWHIINVAEDEEMRLKVKNQLSSIKNYLEGFIDIYLETENKETCKKILRSNLTYDLVKGKRQKRIRLSTKKRHKHFDFPDIREAMINLFDINVTTCNLNLLNESDDESKCICSCQHHRSPSEQIDSGVTTKNNTSSHSITSSIGNFSLDTSTLTAYSESLDLIVSYNSFQDTSLYSTLLQKPAVERITFYVQVHSIQIKSEQPEQEFESKNIITFFCPTCKTVESEENGLLKHILSQIHCEKIHFVYKTAYIKKCVAAGKEIMPSTVLNPMTMYRDENKIVCFGDAMYGCSLCFENLIVGESVLMAHCMEPEHVERREKLSEILE